MKTHGFDGGEYVFLKLRFSEVPLLHPFWILQYLKTFWRRFLSNSRNLGTHLPTSTSLAIAWVPTLLGRQDGEPMGPSDGSQVGQNSESCKIRLNVAYMDGSVVQPCFLPQETGFHIFWIGPHDQTWVCPEALWIVYWSWSTAYGALLNL